jgi:hypothetical protein
MVRRSCRLHEDGADHGAGRAVIAEQEDSALAPRDQAFILPERATLVTGSLLNYLRTESNPVECRGNGLSGKAFKINNL